MKGLSQADEPFHVPQQQGLLEPGLRERPQESLGVRTVQLGAGWRFHSDSQPGLSRQFDPEASWILAAALRSLTRVLGPVCSKALLSYDSFQEEAC